MVVVADTSPLNYLVQISHEEVLPSLFGQIWIPKAVFVELSHARAPERVAAWVRAIPEWLIVVTVEPSEDSADLDRGEREALALAEVHRPSVLLIADDGRARDTAALRGIPTTGTLGVLDTAAAAGLLDLRGALGKLRATNFHGADHLFAILLERDARRRGH